MRKVMPWEACIELAGGINAFLAKSRVTRLPPNEFLKADFVQIFRKGHNVKVRTSAFFPDEPSYWFPFKVGAIIRRRVKSQFEGAMPSLTTPEQALITKIDEEGRISLSTKQLETTPGDMLHNRKAAYAKAAETAKAFMQCQEAAGGAETADHSDGR